MTCKISSLNNIRGALTTNNKITGPCFLHFLVHDFVFFVQPTNHNIFRRNLTRSCRIHISFWWYFFQIFLELLNMLFDFFKIPSSLELGLQKSAPQVCMLFYIEVHKAYVVDVSCKSIACSYICMVVLNGVTFDFQ